MEKSNYGRGLFREHAPLNIQKKGTPSSRQLRWMQLLNLHGCLPSSIVFASEGDKDKSKIRAAQAQFHSLWCKRDKVGEREGFVYRPKQQRATDNANYHSLVYALTEKGEKHLKDKGLWVDAIRPKSTTSADKWPHNFMIACITASIHIMCEREGYRYVPPHEYLSDVKGARVENIPFEFDGARLKKTMTPDAVFAIDYGNGSSIAYCLEADRATEPQEPNDPDRKSAKRSFLQYQTFIGKKLYKDAYKRDPKMVMLYVTVSEHALRRALEIAETYVGSRYYLAFNYVPEFDGEVYNDFKPPKLLSYLFYEWQRVGKDPFTIKKTAS